MTEYPTVAMDTPIGRVQVTIRPDQTTVSIPRAGMLAINGVPYHGYAHFETGHDGVRRYRGGSLYRENGSHSTDKARETFNTVARIADEMATTPERIQAARRAELAEAIVYRREWLADVQAKAARLEAEIAALEAFEPDTLIYDLTIWTDRNEYSDVDIYAPSEPEACERARGYLRRYGDFQRAEMFRCLAPSIRRTEPGSTSNIAHSVARFYKSDLSDGETDAD